MVNFHTREGGVAGVRVVSIAVLEQRPGYATFTAEEAHARLVGHAGLRNGSQRTGHRRKRLRVAPAIIGADRLLSGWVIAAPVDCRRRHNHATGTHAKGRWSARGNCRQTHSPRTPCLMQYGPALLLAPAHSPKRGQPSRSHTALGSRQSTGEGVPKKAAFSQRAPKAPSAASEGDVDASGCVVKPAKLGAAAACSGLANAVARTRVESMAPLEYCCASTFFTMSSVLTVTIRNECLSNRNEKLPPPASVTILPVSASDAVADARKPSCARLLLPLPLESPATAHSTCPSLVRQLAADGRAEHRAQSTGHGARLRCAAPHSRVASSWKERYWRTSACIASSTPASSYLQPQTHHTATPQHSREQHSSTAA